MSIQQGYDTWATTYDVDRNLTRDLDLAVTRTALAALRPATALELGCGTGKNTALLAEIAGHVQALDFSAGMLAQARRKITSANVTFAVADLTLSWPCATGGVELVVGNLVLEHIAALPFIFAEAARCLAPGGHFFLAELHPFKQYLGSQARFQGEQGEILLPAFTHHISDFLHAAAAAGLRLLTLDETWHTEDRDAPPRLVSFLWKKPDDR